ncbi:MAG: hypothetical protein KGR26_11905 [Cyanobacteria bacterium REEB65]|nr:hypothetical protein [Cyanobacteria bacterium REEB65]
MIVTRRFSARCGLAVAALLVTGLALRRLAGSDAGVFGTWLVGRDRIAAEVALLGARPPAGLAPPGRDPRIWLMAGDPHLATMVRGRIHEEAVLRQVALALGAHVTPEAVASQLAKLRADALWATLGRQGNWDDRTWVALARHCAWQDAAIALLPRPDPPSPGELLALYRHRFGGTAISFDRALPSLREAWSATQRMRALRARIGALSGHVHDAIWMPELQGEK